MELFLRRVDFGPNSNPSGHQALVAQTAALLFLREADQPQPALTLTPQEAGQALFAIALHDIDETVDPVVERQVGSVVGDIRYGQKTPKQREQLTRIRKFLMTTVFPDLTPAVHTAYEELVSHAHPESPSHQLFHAAHLIAEAQTGLTAGNAYREIVSPQPPRSERSSKNPDHEHMLFATYLEVCNNTLRPLRSLDHFTLVRDFLASITETK